MKPAPRPGPRRRLAFAAGLTVLHAGLLVLLGTSAAGRLASNGIQLAAGVMAAIACQAAYRRAEGYARRFWGLCAAAFWIWSAAQAHYSYYEVWLGRGVPAPSWAHFLFRLYGAPLLMLLLLEDEPEARGLDWQLVFDLCQVGIVFLFFYFDLYFVPGSAWQGLAGLVILGFLDLSDLENWGLLLAFVLRGRLAQGPVAPLARRLVPFLLAYAATSSFFNYAYSFLGAAGGSWHELPWTPTLLVAALSAAGWRPEASPAGPVRRPPLASVGFNWAPALVPLLTLGLALELARQELTVAFAAVFGSVACFAGRLIATQHRQWMAILALRRSEKRYSDLVQVVPDAVFVHSGCIIRFANPALSRMLRLESPEQVVGRSLLDLAPPEERAALAERIRAAADTGPRIGTLTLRSGDEVVILEAVTIPIPRENDPQAGEDARLVVARDVTARQRAEREREALIRELEGKNSELERFTYTVSHDLRSPLVTIRGFLPFIEKAAAAGDVAALRHDMKRVSEATAKMERLLRELLELSRIGRVMAASEPVSFAALAAEAISLAQGRIATSGVRRRLEEPLPVVFGDRGRLLEVVQNLVENAVKFTAGASDPLIEIGARGTTPEGLALLYVRDTGIGIEPRHQERVFGLFDKLDPRTEGTGVGLAIVKRIVELHGGRVWVESEGLGKGATFWFTLPTPPA